MGLKGIDPQEKVAFLGMFIDPPYGFIKEQLGTRLSIRLHGIHPVLVSGGPIPELSVLSPRRVLAFRNIRLHIFHRSVALTLRYPLKDVKSPMHVGRLPERRI